jgi:hypothetical protein
VLVILAIIAYIQIVKNLDRHGLEAIGGLSGSRTCLVYTKLYIAIFLVHGEWHRIPKRQSKFQGIPDSLFVRCKRATIQAGLSSPSERR